MDVKNSNVLSTSLFVTTVNTFLAKTFCSGLNKYTQAIKHNCAL